MTKVFGVLCSNGFCEFDSHTTTNIINKQYEKLNSKHSKFNIYYRIFITNNIYSQYNNYKLNTTSIG